MAATRLLLDATSPLMFFLVAGKVRTRCQPLNPLPPPACTHCLQAGPQAALEAALVLLLLRVPEACSAALASAVALRLSDHLSAALVLRSRASALAAAAAALVLAAAAAAAALALPLIYSHFFPNLLPLPNAAIAAAAVAAAAAAASSAAEGLLYGQGRVAIINASGLFANWVRCHCYLLHPRHITSIIAIVIITTITALSQVVALPLAVWLLHAQSLPPVACVCAALASGHIVRTVSHVLACDV